MELMPFMNDPFMTDVDRTMNRLMASMFGRPTTSWDVTRPTMPTLPTTVGTTTLDTSMPMDIIEKPDSYELEADCPGMTPDDVKVELYQGVLTVSGSRKVAREEKGAHAKVWRSERASYSFSRAFTLPGNAKGEDICAAMDKGVLKVCIPKTPAPPKPEPKRIAVRGQGGEEATGLAGTTTTATATTTGGGGGGGTTTQ